MSLNIHINERGNPFVSYSASALLHVAMLIVVLLFLNISADGPRINPRLVLVTTQEINTNDNSHAGKAVQLHKKIFSEDYGVMNNDINKKLESLKQFPESNFYSIENTEADTTNLDQVYNEPTLNVSMKYPAGWTYIDQNVNKKLDGVTFWSAIGNYSLPPYINLEVRDKDLFDAKRYKFNLKTWGYIIFYNEPEEMETQVSQIFYIRTNSGEDFSLKLIMNGKDEFKSFQPVFFGILKSFKFGKGLF
jgi:hypothetical protein